MYWMILTGFDHQKMNLGHFIVYSLLLLGTSYTVAEEMPNNTSLPSSPSSLPTTWPSTPQSSPAESTQDAEIDAMSSPRPSVPQPNQTQPATSTLQTQRLPEQKMEAAPFLFSDDDIQDSGRRQPKAPAVEGVAFVLMKPKGHWPVGIPQEASSRAMGLFLGGCGLLLCLFIGVYCAYSRGAKKEPFSHHRLYEDGFDDPALFLDNPKEYDWFFYETDGYVYPASSQAQMKPIQTLSVPTLKQPTPVLDKSPETSVTPEAGRDSKQPHSNVKLECLSPANLHTGNFI